MTRHATHHHDKPRLAWGFFVMRGIRISTMQYQHYQPSPNYARKPHTAPRWRGQIKERNAMTTTTTTTNACACCGQTIKATKPRAGARTFKAWADFTPALTAARNAAVAASARAGIWRRARAFGRVCRRHGCPARCSAVRASHRAISSCRRHGSGRPAHCRLAPSMPRRRPRRWRSRHETAPHLLAPRAAVA